MQSNRFLLYGANGYTGELIARYAAQYGLEPIVAGRDAAKIRPLAERLQLTWQVIDLNDKDALLKALREVKVVLHAAGPFRYTAKQMVEACLETGTHYLDINGDISVFEFIKRYDEKAKQAGVMLMPGVGFDVVPTDCISLLLHKALPDAVSLKLAFASLGGGLSHGTAVTMADKLGEGGAQRISGEIKNVPLGRHGMTIDFWMKQLFVMSIPWGDVSTAHFTTGIPDIETFTGVTKNTYRMLKLQGLFNWILRMPAVRGYIKKKIGQKPAGPSDERREKAIGFVWGQAKNAAGKTVSARLTGPEGYTLTLHSSLLVIRKVLEGEIKTGYQTPAKVYGEDLVLEVPGMKREWVEQ